MIKPDFFYWFPYEEVITIVQILAAGNVDKLQCDTMVSILFLAVQNSSIGLIVCPSLCYH